MKQKVKQLRVQIDGLAQLSEELTPILLDRFLGSYTNTSETAMASNSLYLAKAWLGKVLGELGEDSPYPKDGTRKTIEDIEPTADRADVINTIDLEGFIGKLHIEKVDWLRQEISKVIKQGIEAIEKSDEQEKYMETSVIYNWFLSKNHLAEARFWLGFELERIRKHGS